MDVALLPRCMQDKGYILAYAVPEFDLSIRLATSGSTAPARNRSAKPQSPRTSWGTTGDWRSRSGSIASDGTVTA